MHAVRFKLMHCCASSSAIERTEPAQDLVSVLVEVCGSANGAGQAIQLSCCRFDEAFFLSLPAHACFASLTANELCAQSTWDERLLRG